MNWLLERLHPDLFRGVALESIVYSGRTQFQEVSIVDTPSFGRLLLLDGKTQSSELDEFVYHEALVHPALVAHPHPVSVFIGGGGEGATAREALRHRTVQNVTMIDIDQEVVELCRKYFPEFSRGVFENPRFDFRVADARRFLEEEERLYDVIILDLTDPVEEGPSVFLYTKEFYELLRNRLTREGIVVTQAGPATLLNYQEVFSPVFRTFKEVFPVVRAYTVPMLSFGFTWGFVMGSLGRDPAAMEASEVDRILEARGVQEELRFYDGIQHIGLFSLPRYLRIRLESETRVVTQAHPTFLF
ncbi:polyamine aminopropyltransferase [Candidatus Methylacidithermus pantelleriae]|uniref:polyamine aminopropyltransferase n=1 Tax=Candidatus Methylacidithermus pantelleriae TaxID=2744239 RepID=UPI001BD4BF92|nr:polyamine aminopropyltransferase [Candidatus Methylacidithermus pantelleriae]